MPALPIIEYLDVFEDVLGRLFAGRVAPMVHELALEGPEEALGTGVVPAVAFTAHAGDEAVRIESALVARGRILTAAVRVVHDLPGQIWSRVNVRLDRNQGGQRGAYGLTSRDTLYQYLLD